MSSAARKPQVLLIEDSEDDAFFFRWTLEKCGLESEVSHVADGPTAIAHLQQVFAGARPLPDLVFLDLKLPAFSGFEVLAWIRRHDCDPPLDIAVLSGSEHAGDVARARALGASGYYVKPVSVEQLRARFAAWRDTRETNPRLISPERHKHLPVFHQPTDFP